MAPPLPPKLAPPPPGVMARAASSMPAMPTNQAAKQQALQELQSSVGELEAWAGKMMTQLDALNPPLKALLVPIVNAGKALSEQVEEMMGQAQGGTSIPGSGGSTPSGADGAGM